ncbi:unnamed protein product [Allacma fusca]|uniref:Mitochondrial coenzyme A transporter SLC25A42 n=1 Tax=Allacma fusca TaxID=39272 RepID=A0A8J2JI21_9HEXA|nr:unnamed protein product [Allacma fusca]
MNPPKETPALSHTKRVTTSLIAGAFAGAIAKTAIAPLDRTKINFQTSHERFSHTKAAKFIVKTYRQDGLFSLWRGNSATMARIVPYAALQFSAHEQWKHVLGIVDHEHGKHTSETLQYKRFVAGSLAGMTAQSLTYPLDLTRARLAVSPRSRYTNLLDVFSKIVKEEGFSTLYRGYIATMVGVIPYAGTSFFVYESLKNWHARKSEQPINPLERLIYGATAGGIAQTSSYPLDIVRRRLQVGQFSRGYSYSIIGILKEVYREEGIFHGWFKGITLNFIKGPIAVGLSFVTFDLMQNFLRTIV